TTRARCSEPRSIRKKSDEGIPRCARHVTRGRRGVRADGRRAAHPARARLIAGVRDARSSHRRHRAAPQRLARRGGRGALQHGAKVNGKIVFFNVPMDMEMVRARRSFEAYSKAVVYRGLGASRAAEYGAAAVVIRSVGSDSLRTPHTGGLRYDPKLPKIPAAAMTAEDAMLVHRLLARKERVRMHLVLTPRTLPDVMSANVVAEIRGSEHPEEIVLIGAHLDSWDLGTGAIDDGSGVAMVMETMRLMKQMNLRPR